MCLCRVVEARLRMKTVLDISRFQLLLKLFPTVAGASAGQEGGEVTGEGFHL